jgi:hypothetical protein
MNINDGLWYMLGAGGLGLHCEEFGYIQTIVGRVTMQCRFTFIMASVIERISVLQGCRATLVKSAATSMHV